MRSHINYLEEKENCRDVTKMPDAELASTVTFYKATNLKVLQCASVLFAGLLFVPYRYFSSLSFFARYISETHGVLGTVLPEQVPGGMHGSAQRNTACSSTAHVKHPVKQPSYRTRYGRTDMEIIWIVEKVKN